MNPHKLFNPHSHSALLPVVGRASSSDAAVHTSGFCAVSWCLWSQQHVLATKAARSKQTKGHSVVTFSLEAGAAVTKAVPDSSRYLSISFGLRQPHLPHGHILLRTVCYTSIVRYTGSLNMKRTQKACCQSSLMGGELMRHYEPTRVAATGYGMEWINLSAAQ